MMVEIKTERIKDFGDGEVRYKISLDFVIFTKNTNIENVQAEIEEIVYKYAI